MGKFGAAAEDHESEGGHGDRPWVYFMIDAFMLIVVFLVLDFKFKVGDIILPHKLPPGGTIASKAVVLDKIELLPIHVKRNSSGTGAEYEIFTQACNLQELAGRMASTVSSGKKFQIRVSYEKNVPWGDVIAVFNECTRLKIDQCGLVPLRGVQE